MRYITLLGFLALTSPILAAVPKTTITGTLQTVAGTAPQNCTVKATLSSPMSVNDTSLGAAAKHAIGTYTQTFNVTNPSAVFIQLVPNVGSGNAPSNTFYDVKITSATGVYSQKWQVPTSAPAVRVTDCIIDVPAGTATNFVPQEGGTFSGAVFFNNSFIINPISLPGSGVLGQFAYNIADNTPYYWNGSSFVPLGSTLASVQHDSSLSGLGTGGSPLAVAPAGVTHNSLGGLTTGDPHTQYVLAAGTRAFSGNQSFGGYQATSMRLENLAAGSIPAASSGNKGLISYNTTTNGVVFSDGTRNVSTSATALPYAIPVSGADGKIAGGFYSSPTHGATHAHGGGDEFAVTTSAANAVPKAGASGNLGAAWIDEVINLADLLNVTMTGAAEHNVLALNGSGNWVNAVMAGDVTCTLSGNTLTTTVGTSGKTSVTVNGTAHGATATLVLNGARASSAAAGVTTVTLRPETGRNLVMNGDFIVAQRGTSFASVANGAFTLDRFKYVKVGAAVHDVSQSSLSSPDVPTFAQAGVRLRSSLLVDCTTTDASIAAGDLVAVGQSIEGFRWAFADQKALVLSFWAKHTKTGTYCVSLINSGLDRSCVGTYTISVSDTWEYKTVTFVASPTAGTWNYTNGVGAYLFFTLAAGSTYQTTAGSYQTGQFYATSAQVNACDSTSNNFRLTGVQLEVGPIGTSYEMRDFAEEIRACQRYFVRIGGIGSEIRISGYQTAGNTSYETYVLHVPMRIAPGVTKAGTWSVTNCSQPSFGSSTTVTFGGSIIVTATGAGQALSVDSSTYIDLNSDL